MTRFRRILVPTDFSDCARCAMPFALELSAGRGDTEIVLAHVIEPPIYPAMFEGGGLAAGAAFTPEVRERVVEHLDAEAEKHRAARVRRRSARCCARASRFAS